MKKLSLLLAALLLVCFVASCTGNGNPAETKAETNGQESGIGEVTDVQTEAVTEVPDEKKYANNPKLEAAYRVDDKTVRIKFSEEVNCPNFDLAKYAYVSTASDVYTVKSQATGFKAYNYIWDTMDNVANFTVADLYFTTSIPADGMLCFTEDAEESNHDGALKGVVENYRARGLYAANRADGKTPVASVELGATEIPQPEIETRLEFAFCENRENGDFIFKFTKPVRVIDDWTFHLFICDCSNPDPAAADFWQYNANSVICLDPHVGEDELVYGSIYLANFTGDFHDTGVLRFSENDSGATNEYNTDPDNVDLGRIIVAEDGTPLLATDTIGWDVAHCAYYYENLLGIEYDIPEA